MKNKKFLIVLVASIMAVLVSVFATVAAFGAGNQATVYASDYDSSVIDAIPSELGAGDTLIVYCDSENKAFVVTEDAPALESIRFVRDGVTVITGLELATTATTTVEGGFEAEITGLGIAVEIKDDVTLPSSVAGIFGNYADYIIGVGAAEFNIAGDQVNNGEKVTIEAVVAMPAGAKPVVYDADYNVVASSWDGSKVTFEAELGDGYAIAPEIVAVVDGVGYTSLDAAIDVAEGSFDKPVALIGGGSYVLDTDSQVVVGIAGDATVTVADGVLSYNTEVDYDGEKYTAYALYQQDYLFADVANNITNSESGYSASYADGKLDLSVKLDKLSNLPSTDDLYEVLGAFAPLAVLSDTLSFDEYTVFDGTFDMQAAKDFAMSQMISFNEIAGLTDKTIVSFDVSLVSGTTTTTIPVSLSLDCSDEQFEDIKADAATVAEYVIVMINGSDVSLIIDAVELYAEAVERTESLNGLTTKEIRTKLNGITIKEFIERLEKANVSDKYATVIDIIAKIKNKVLTTDYAYNLDVPLGAFDLDEDGVYFADKTIDLSTKSLVDKVKGIINERYPEYADLIDVDSMFGEQTITVEADATIKIFDTYTATFVSLDGTTIYETEVLAGEVPEFAGEEPAKAADETNVYVFFGWNDGIADYSELPGITGDTTYTAVFETIAIEAVDPAINATNAAVVFTGNMVLKFYIPKTALEGFENFYANIVITTQNGSVSYELEGTENGDFYQFAVEGIPAKQMNDDVSIEIVATKTILDTQITRTSEVKSYSVRAYAYSRLGSANATDVEKTMLVDFLNYGAAAQTYFGYDADNLVNADLTDEQKAFGTSEVPQLESHFSYEGRETELIFFKGASVLFSDGVYVKFVLNFNYYAGTPDDVHLVITCNGHEKIVPGSELVANSVFYTYSYDGLAMKDLRAPMTVTVVETATGRVVSGPLTYSVETYAYNMMDSVDANFTALLQNLMKFSASAAAFL